MNEAKLPYSVVREFEGIYFVSGQLPSFEGDEQLFENQVLSSLDNMSKVLEAQLSDWSKVLKINVYVTDLNNYEAFNQIYLDYLSDYSVLPTRTMFEVQKLPKNSMVEIDAVFCK